jgi:hypothetical protein
MTNTFLLSEIKLREYTDLDNNIDSALIKNAIRESQDIRLQSIIGTLLYNKIMDLVDTNEIDLPANSNYKTLLDSYIQNYLIYAAYWYSLDAIYLRSRNNGLIQPNGGENSDAVDRSLYNLKRQSVESKMEFYAEKLTEYIIEENTLFPELNDSNKLYEQNPDYSNKYGSPFVFNKWNRTAEEFVKRGYRVYDTSRKQYPQ